jgi:PAS domain S-box-containing protein
LLGSHTVLVVHADPVRAQKTARDLEELGFDSEVLEPDAEGLRGLMNPGIHAVILPLSVAKTPAWAAALRAQQVKEEPLAVILWVDRESAREVSETLQQGDYEFLREPIERAELGVRLTHLIRAREERVKATLSFGDLEMNRVTHRVICGDVELSPTPREYGILERLLMHSGEVVTRTELRETVFGLEFDPGTNAIDVHIRHLRQKLEEARSECRVTTVRGVGFRLSSGQERPRIRMLLEAAPDAMIAADGEGRILEVSRKAAELFGYEPEELIGVQVEQLIPHPDRGKHAEHRRDFAKSPKARPMGRGVTLRGLHKDGSTLPLDISLGPVEVGGEPLVVAAVRVLDPQGEEENGRGAAGDAAGAMAYAGEVAHELANILTFTQGRVELLLLEENIPPRVRAELMKIDQANSNASALLQAFLGYNHERARSAAAEDVGEVVGQPDD